MLIEIMEISNNEKQNNLDNSKREKYYCVNLTATGKKCFYGLQKNQSYFAMWKAISRTTGFDQINNFQISGVFVNMLKSRLLVTDLYM